MSGREILDWAQSSDGPALFTALAWERLPEFLNSRVPGDWWLDASVSVRLLSEFAALSHLDVIQVPAVRDMREPRETVAGRDSAAAIECVSQLVVIGTRVTMAVVPPVAVLRAASPGIKPEDVEDDLRDLVSDLLNAGAEAICVRGDDAQAVGDTVDGLTRLVRHFGRALVGLSGALAVSATESLDVFAFAIGDAWPVSGLAMATGDLSQESPLLLQEWIRDRA